MRHCYIEASQRGARGIASGMLPILALQSRLPVQGTLYFVLIENANYSILELTHRAICISAW